MLLRLPAPPQKSPRHRHAALTLFRCLWRQSRRAAADHGTVGLIRNVIRNRFRHHKPTASKPILTAAFKAGYEAVDLLEASSRGDNGAFSRITRVLQQMPKSHLRAQARKSVMKKASTSDSDRPKSSIFARPRPQVSGIRRIPRFVLAGGIPILRIKKPQPLALSGYIRSRMHAHQKRIADLIELDNYWIPLSQREDEWDRILHDEFGQTGPEGSDSLGNALWSDEMVRSRNHVNWKVGKDYRKNLAVEVRMREIVEEEKRLAEIERQKRREKRRAGIDASAGSVTAAADQGGNSSIGFTREGSQDNL